MLCIWNLQKSACVASVELSGAECVAFDATGSYVAVGGAGVSIFQVPSLEKVVEVDHASVVVSIAFGEDARSLVFGDEGGNVKTVMQAM